MTDKPAEQAYHARGAGLREALELIRRTPTMPFPDPGAHSWRAFAEAVHRSYVRIQQVAEAALREPGADTGTTPLPSTAEFEPLLRGELKHGRSCPAVGAPMDEGNCDCGLKWRIRLQTEMTLRNAWEKRAYEAEAALAAAERGTTPPEGLEFGLKCAKCGNGPIVEKDIHCEICSPYAPSTIPQACLDAIAKYCNSSTLKEGAAYLRELERAATQRAPVEQARASQSCPKCAARERVRALFDRKWNKANPEIVSVDEVQEALAGVDLRKAAAPDHAREGALRRLVTKWREGKVATKLRDDMQMRGGKWIADLCADELEHALANGKEEPL